MLEHISLLLVLILSVLVIAFVRYRPTQYERSSGYTSPSKPADGSRVSVQILVLGDIGHSPRMQNHALSIAKHGGNVSIIGYQSSTPNAELLSNHLISIVPLSPPSGFLQNKNTLLFPIIAMLKVIQQAWCLWHALAYRSNPSKWMLVQNPPSIPTLALAQIVCRLRNTHLIIDWHNFGYSILALKLGDKHPMVKLMAYHERTLCHFATAHFCVSNAMACVLRRDMKIKNPVLVLHDRPPAIFTPLANDRERSACLSSIPETSQRSQDIMSGRCELLVSSTSWTPDEDFALFIDALCRYSNLASSSHQFLPHLLVIITGKGPQKQAYLSKISKLTAEGKLSKVVIKTAWLTFENYARLLACASLGVCLHTSSSGVDLPMKVVDMFGAGLPVVGWDKYKAWPELVTEGVNGRGFGSAEELSGQLVDLFGENPGSLVKLREGALIESNSRWDETWDPIAKKLFELGK